VNKNRLEAFSDGVLAIIITIMVLELKIPEGTSFQSLRPVIPEFLSYFLSFVFIGIYWGNHHHLLHTVQRVSSGIIWSNLNLLFWLSLVPIATGWMGTNHFAQNAVAVYAALLAVCGFAYYILQQIIIRCHDFNPLMSEAMRKQSRKGMISQVSYMAAVPLAYVNPLISAAIFVIIAVLWIIPDKNIERAFYQK
jgi:uncharacterized membrane protein